MADKIPDQTRAAIEQAIRNGAGKASCRGLAREHGVSAGTVRNIAKAAGLTGAFTRASTLHATRARTADMADRRTRLAERLLTLAESIGDRLDSSYTVVVQTQHDVFRETLDVPPLKEVKDGMAAVGTAIQRHIELVKFDTKDGGSEQATSLLDAVAAGLSSAYAAITGAPPSTETVTPDE